MLHYTTSLSLILLPLTLYLTDLSLYLSLYLTDLSLYLTDLTLYLTLYLTDLSLYLTLYLTDLSLDLESRSLCPVLSLDSQWGNYYMHWIRQKPGQGLEWIGRIDTGTGTIFAQSLQGQFSITKDTNKNMLYLEVKSLKAEDTAVYYCVSSDEIRLDQSPAVVKKPGETVKISCKIHGFVTTSINFVSWIRQKPGKALEWLGRIKAGSNIAEYAESVKNQLTLTEDVSASTQYLEAKSLRTEDTAVYYCAQKDTVTGAEEAAVLKPYTHCN
ncbi:hypothetical protein QTP86_003324 [Hemibagrus guttatus]|nr:hypothetical protein QTP86_003324 [Hemibagrus guttatus]